MPIVPGKPGSNRVRGTIRKQLQKAAQMVTAILDYNEKLANKEPPTIWLTLDQINSLTPIPNLCATIWTEKN